MQTRWWPVTLFDPLFAIRQKRGGEAPSENPPKTRENRITTVGNDLYSADSRSFLNPFLRISRCARLFPSHAQRDLHPRPTKLSPLVTNPAPHFSHSLSSLSLFLSLFSISHESCVEVTARRYTFPQNGNCSVSQITPALFSHRESSSLRIHGHAFVVHVVYFQLCPETSIHDTLT